MSGRMRQVLERYAQGWTYREIAAELHIAVSTVHEYLDRIRHNYGMRARKDLVRLWQLIGTDSDVQIWPIGGTDGGLRFAYLHGGVSGTVVALSFEEARGVVLGRSQEVVTR